MYQALIGNGFTILYVLGMGIYYGKVHDDDRKILIREKERLIKAKKSIQTSISDSSGKQGLLESEFIELNNIMKDSGLDRQWEQLMHSDIRSTRVDEHGEKRVYFTHDIYDILDPCMCVTEIEGYKRRTLVPSFMTGLGILGTFFGLTGGLWNLDINASGSGLLSSINTLISSSGTAFVTSLVGIFLSLFHIYKFHSLERDIKQAIDELVSMVHSRIKYWTIFDELGDIKQILTKSNENIENMGGSINELSEYATNVANNVVQKTGQSIKDKVGHQFAEEFNELVGTITRLKEYLEDERTKNNELKEDVKTTMENSLTKLNETIEVLDTNWSAKIEDIRNFETTVKEKISSASSVIEGTTKAMGDSLSNMSDTLEALKNGTVDALDKSITNLNDNLTTLNTLVENQKEMLDKTTGEYKQTIEDGHSSFVNALDGNKQIIKDMITQAEQSNTDRDDTLAKMLNILVVLEDKVKDSVNTVCNEAIETIQKEASSSNQMILEKAQELQKESFDEFSRELKEILTKVSGAIQDQTDAITGEKFINDIKLAINDNRVEIDKKDENGELNAK